MLFLKAFSYFNDTEMQKKFIHLLRNNNYITLSLSESKIKTAVAPQNVLENFSVDILNNQELYEERT